MARWAGTVDEVHAVPLYDGPETMIRTAAEIAPSWDFILGNPRRAQPLHAAAVPGFADWWPIVDR